MRLEYALGTAQWDILFFMLFDGGALTTREVAAAIGREGFQSKVRRKLETLKRRGLVEENTVGRRTSIWTLRIHTE